MSCEVCSAPSLPREGACVFCHSPLSGGPELEGLLDYLAERLPQARPSRGLLRRGEVRDLRIEAGATVYRGHLKSGRIEFEPPLDPVPWVEALLAGLSRRAAGDPELRAAMSRSGWALR